MTEPIDPSSEVEASPPPPSLLRRIMAKVETLPFRYAPFFDRLAVLFDVPAGEIEAALGRAGDPRTWRRTLLPGVRRVTFVPGPRLRGAEAYFMRLSPGISFPKHRHRGSETLFVLEGYYVDTAGTRVGPGERQDMAHGSEHGLTAGEEGPCIAAVVARGVDFSGPVLGKLTHLVQWLRRGATSGHALDEPNDAEQHERRVDGGNQSAEERRTAASRRDQG